MTHVSLNICHYQRTIMHYQVTCVETVCKNWKVCRIASNVSAWSTRMSLCNEYDLARKVFYCDAQVQCQALRDGKGYSDFHTFFITPLAVCSSSIDSSAVGITQPSNCKISFKFHHLGSVCLANALLQLFHDFPARCCSPTVLPLWWVETECLEWPCNDWTLSICNFSTWEN